MSISVQKDKPSNLDRSRFFRKEENLQRLDQALIQACQRAVERCRQDLETLNQAANQQAQDKK